MARTRRIGIAGSCSRHHVPDRLVFIARLEYGAAIRSVRRSRIAVIHPQSRCGAAAIYRRHKNPEFCGSGAVIPVCPLERICRCTGGVAELDIGAGAVAIGPDGTIARSKPDQKRIIRFCGSHPGNAQRDRLVIRPAGKLCKQGS